jgi:shikimate dehydrogenase
MTEKQASKTQTDAERRDEENRLDAQRRMIDRIDGEILRLFNERLEVAARIGAMKSRLQLPVRDTRREAEVFHRLMGLNRGRLLANRYVVRVFAALMAAARDVQGAGSHPADGFGTPAMFAVFGNPVVHSLSPVMHNAAFAATGVNGMYAAIRVKDIRPAMAGMRALGFRGASITIPHKEAVLACLDYIDPDARRIKAVNTIVNDDGSLKGFNTDGYGILRALAEKIPINGRRVGILGAGGAARAVAYSVIQEGAAATIFNRSREKGEALAADLGLDFRALSEFAAERIDILVNTTPVGMFPREQDTPLTAEQLRPGLVVMDIVYNPVKTRLLREAEAAGCVTIDGLSMFVYQGVRQFELWTGLEAPVEIMRMAVEAELMADS